MLFCRDKKFCCDLHTFWVSLVKKVFFWVKNSISSERSVSQHGIQKGSVKKQNNQNQIYEHMRHARGVGYVQISRYLAKKIYCYIRNTCKGPYLVYFWTNLHEILAPCLKSNCMTTSFFTFLHNKEALTSLRPPGGDGGGQKP